MTSPNATFREITDLRLVPWLGEVVSIPVGEPSPWRILIHVSTVLLLIYVVDAGVAAWRRGNRRRAAFLSGPIAGAILLSALFSQLMVWNVVPGPFIGLVFLLLVLAMAIELSIDLIRARQNALDLRRSEERLSLAARAARGDAATEIIEYTTMHQLDLIVAGSRGLSEFKGWWMGSVSRKLVHYAKCSVLIVKGPRKG